MEHYEYLVFFVKFVQISRNVLHYVKEKLSKIRF